VRRFEQDGDAAIRRSKQIDSRYEGAVDGQRFVEFARFTKYLREIMHRRRIFDAASIDASSSIEVASSIVDFAECKRSARKQDARCSSTWERRISSFGGCGGSNGIGCKL